MAVRKGIFDCEVIRYSVLTYLGQASMDVPDFEMPSPKRQKTNSPPQAPIPPLHPSNNDTSGADHSAENVAENLPTKFLAEGSTLHDQGSVSRIPDSKEEDMLDVLMQHVESEAASKDIQIPSLKEEGENQSWQNEDQKDKHIDRSLKKENDSDIVDVEPTVKYETQPESQQPLDKTSTSTTTSQQAPIRNLKDDNPLEATDLPKGLEPADPNTIDHLRTVAEANALPPTSDTLASDQIPPATEGIQLTSDTAVGPPEAREWETDSSPYDSSSSDDTSSDSDSSDDEDEDEDEEYTLLDPYEQARILMAEDGGGGGGDDGNSDDEGRPTSNRPNVGLRTVNEKPEEILPKPNITITDSMPIEELGTIQAIVENTLLITAKTSGEYRVLESNSLLCTASRIPIGVVAETLGRVEAPLYTVRFASETDIVESGVSEKGTKIYYVPEHSTFVFTQPLKAVKGSDASNFHDEEVGDDEMEFSDDEAEAEHKRQMKLRKKGIDPNSVPPPSRGGRGGRGQRGRGGRGGGGMNSNMHAIPESDTASAYGTGSVEMNYDDVEEGETDYTPLRRPESMTQTSPHQINGGMSPPQPQQQFNFRGGHDPRGGRGGRGRGTPNRGRGGRGGYTQTQNQNNRTSYNQNFTAYSSNRYAPSSTTSMYATNQSPQSQPQPQGHFNHTLPPPPPPPAPYLTPSSGPYPTTTGSGGSGTPTGLYTVPPSPMTPLPGGQFNFAFGNAQAQGQTQMQGQWAQYHANLNQYQQQAGAYGGTNANADAIAQVQRTLEELRRAAGSGGYGGGGFNAGQQ